MRDILLRQIELSLAQGAGGPHSQPLVETGAMKMVHALHAFERISGLEVGQADGAGVAVRGGARLAHIRRQEGQL